MTTQLFVGAFLVYLGVLVATGYFTRATARRVAGALAGGAAVAVVGIGVEMLAHTMGWWRYPFVDTPYGPPLMYPVVVVVMAALALLGWRVSRRWGWRGQLVFLVAVTVLGTLRDYRVAAWSPEIFVLAPGIGPMLADAACWTGTVALAQAVMRLVAGPAGSDALARRHGEKEG